MADCDEEATVELTEKVMQLFDIWLQIAGLVGTAKQQSAKLPVKICCCRNSYPTIPFLVGPRDLNRTAWPARPRFCLQKRAGAVL
jgi:hypothetical protein